VPRWPVAPPLRRFQHVDIRDRASVSNPPAPAACRATAALFSTLTSATAHPCRIGLPRWPVAPPLLRLQHVNIRDRAFVSNPFAPAACRATAALFSTLTSATAHPCRIGLPRWSVAPPLRRFQHVDIRDRASVSNPPAPAACRATAALSSTLTSATAHPCRIGCLDDLSRHRCPAPTR
jgi:hypothetical protein